MNFDNVVEYPADRQVSTNNIHCGMYCPYIEYADTDVAICKITKNELVWYDFWLAECVKQEENQ